MTSRSHVNETSWNKKKNILSFIAMFSGFAATFLSIVFSAVLYIFAPVPTFEYAVKLFVLFEFLIITSLLIAILIAAAARTVFSAKHKFLDVFKELLKTGEQSWLFVPLVIAMGAYLVIGGV